MKEKGIGRGREVNEGRLGINGESDRGRVGWMGRGKR